MKTAIGGVAHPRNHLPRSFAHGIVILELTLKRSFYNSGKRLILARSQHADLLKQFLGQIDCEISVTGHINMCIT